MKRINQIEIAGVNYPMNFSVKATKDICGKFGSVDGIFEKLSKMPEAEQLTESVWMVWLLIDQGVKYLKLQGGEDIIAPSQDDLEIILSLTDLHPLYQKIAETMYGAVVTEVQAEEIKKNTGTIIMEKIAALRGLTSTGSN